MAASGASASSITSSSIYAKMEPSVAQEKLTATLRVQYAQGFKPTQLWLLRESRINGCLTLSSLEMQKDGAFKNFDRRFALVQTNEGTVAWTNVSETAVLQELVKENKIVFMNMHTARKEENSKFCALLFDSFKEMGFLPEHYLNPSVQDSSRNSIYSSISHCAYMADQLDDFSVEEERFLEMLNKIEKAAQDLREQNEDQICPITQEMPESVASILTTPHLYEPNELRRWVAQRGSDPMSRAPVTTEDILLTHAPEKMRRALEKLEQKLSARRVKAN